MAQVTQMTETTETARHAALKAILEARRIEVRDDLRSRMREGRTRQEVGRDALEQTDDDTRGGLAFSLVEMRSETLTLIDRALARLAAGRYGTCVRCDGRDRRTTAARRAVRHALPGLRGAPRAGRAAAVIGRRAGRFDGVRPGRQRLIRRPPRSGQSCRTTLSSELLIVTGCSPSYSMKPSLRNLLRKKFTRDRVVPIISARVSCESFGTTRDGLSFLP